MSSATILVFGHDGQLAEELRRARLPAGAALAALGRVSCDISDRDAAARAVAEHRPAVIINAAAYTAVDKAESEEERAFAVNCDGAGFIAQAGAAAGVPVIHLSSDYVFDGSATAPYGEDAPTGPINAYGRSKLAGEEAVRTADGPHLILRTSWVYSRFGSNFVRTMLRLAASRPEVGVVADQRGCPTAAADLARMILEACARILAGEALSWGTYHLCGAGPTTWHGFAAEIFRQASLRGHPVPKLKAIGTADYPTPARRPAFSVLDCRRAARRLELHPRPWRDSLADCLAELLEPAARAAS